MQISNQQMETERKLGIAQFLMTYGNEETKKKIVEEMTSLYMHDNLRSVSSAVHTDPPVICNRRTQCWQSTVIATIHPMIPIRSRIVMPFKLVVDNNNHLKKFLKTT